MKLEDAIILRIEELKISHSITQYELSQRSGVPQTTLISIKKKRSKDVGIKTLWLIVDGFELSIQDFFKSDIFKKDNITVE